MVLFEIHHKFKGHILNELHVSIKVSLLHEEKIKKENVLDATQLEYRTVSMI